MNSYTWDRANRMLSMGGSSYAYDGAGNRITQTVGMDVTKYLLDLQPGLANVLQATQGSDVTRYVHAPRGIHAQQDASGDWTWMLQDGLGSVRSVVDSSLNPLESRLYEPYGTPFGTSGTVQTSYGFTGEMTDANELLYLRARYYAPCLGVFTGLDPFEGIEDEPMSLNGYSWVEGNVPNIVDPSGTCGQPTNWGDPFDVNCYYSADGLARRFSNGDPSAYQSWFNVLIQKQWGELKALEAGGSLTDASGGSRQFLNNAAIIPRLFRQNPMAALQALQQFACQNRGTIQGFTATAVIASVNLAAQSGVLGNITGGATAATGGLSPIAGVGLAVVGGIVVAVGGLLLWDDATNSGVIYESRYHMPGFDSRIETLKEHLSKLLGHSVAGWGEPDPNPGGRANRVWCVTLRETVRQLRAAFDNQSQFDRDLRKAGIGSDVWNQIRGALEAAAEICNDHRGGFGGDSLNFN